MQLSPEELFEFANRLKDSKDLAFYRARDEFAGVLSRRLTDLKLSGIDSTYTNGIDDAMKLIESTRREFVP